MDKDTVALMAVILDVYEGGKDVIPGWKLKVNAEKAAEKGVEGVRRYYDNCLAGAGTRVKDTLERHGRKTLESEHGRFMAIYKATTRK